MTRRSDFELRESINVIERMLLSNPGVEVAIERCLSQVMHLTNSEFGYVYKCLDSSRSDGTIGWELCTCKELRQSTLVDLPNSCTSDHIPSSIVSRLLAGQSFVGSIEQEAIPAIPHRHPDISSYLCVPIADAKRIHAVIFVCKTTGEFASGIESRLRPYLAASNCLMRSVHKSAEQPGRRFNQLAEIPDALVQVFDSFFNAIVIVDEDGIVKHCNAAAATLLALPASELIGKVISSFLPRCAQDLESRMKESSENKARHFGEHQSIWRGIPVINAQGKKHLVDLSAFELCEGDRHLSGFVMDDISERMQSAADYHTTLQRFQVLTNLAPVAILQLSRDWACTYVNDTWCEYCQMTPDEAGGRGWLQGIHTNDMDEVLTRLREDTSINGRYEGEFRLESPLGKVVWVKANACSLYSEDGSATGLIITLSDITSHLNNERRLQDIAEKDQLTGLVNRTFFNDRVDQALKGVQRFGAVALMFIDLDEFKHINDTLGHEAGDLLLQGVANRLRDALRQVDTIARIGGDEFTVLLTNVSNTRSITAVADKMLAALADPFVISDRTIYVTCSVGISVAEDEGVETRQLLKQADVALYKAKDAGRNQYKFYTTELDRNADLHIHLLHSLKESGRNDFRVVYQPQVDARSGKIVGLEALARWKHPDVPSIGPDIFIKMIEESGLMQDFAKWLFEEIFSTLQRWQTSSSSTRNVKVAINLSAKQFRDQDLARTIYEQCCGYGVKPDRIVLEVTETALIDDPGLAADSLRELRRLGFGIALDDFGTGYSSLAYLREMPWQTVKIDRSFIKDVIVDREDAKIVAAILSLSEALELKVIAEGVDNEGVKDWLMDKKCFLQQGYLFSKPLEADDVMAAIERNAVTNAKVLPFDGRVR